MAYMDGFTQEKQTNIKVCDGCQNRCRLSVEKNADDTSCRPIIGGKSITFFIDQNGEHQTAVRSIAQMREDGWTPRLIETHMLDLARTIARHCDHYKAR